jgi:polar amino acid transport system substrate-binding protein
MKVFRTLIQLIFVLSISLVIINPAAARDLKATLGLIPPYAFSSDKGMLVDLVKAMDEIYTDGKITIDAFPTARAIDNLLKGTHDFFMPMLKSDTMDFEALPFRFSETLWSSIFVLYTNKNNKEINLSNLANYKIETLSNIISYFDIPMLPSAGLESSLKKVDMGRIDGYIFSMGPVDATLKKLGLKNIKRTNFKTFEGPIVVKKGSNGDEVEAILLPLLKQLRENGTFDKIMAPVLNQEFKEW